MFICSLLSHFNQKACYGAGKRFHLHCMKNNIFVKTIKVNIIFSWFSAIDRNIIFSVKRELKKSSYFCIISDIIRNKSIEQDNGNKKKMIRGLNAVPRGWEIPDCINNYHNTLGLAFFSLYLVVGSNKQFWTAIYNYKRLYTTS